MKIIKILLATVVVVGMLGCTPESGLKEKVGRILKENPEVLTEAIKANPAEFMMAVQEAARNAQSEMAKKRQEAEAKKLQESYDNPLKPMIRPDESFLGDKNAPILLVEYSDFQCPYCSRGYKTVKELKKKYGNKIKFVYKHLPLSFHKQAMIASQYFEAIRLQDVTKAFKFHDVLYENTRKISEGEKYLKSVAKKVGANMTKLAKDLHSKKVKDRIAQDMAEAQKFGMQGTPGFIINGIPVKGAYPASHFENIIEELKKRGKLKL